MRSSAQLQSARSRPFGATRSHRTGYRTALTPSDAIRSMSSTRYACPVSSSWSTVRRPTRTLALSTPPQTSISGGDADGTADAPVRGQSLAHALIHVVVLVSRQAADEMNVRRRPCESLVARVEPGIFGTWDGVVRLAFSARELAHDRGPLRPLPGQVLELGRSRVRHSLVGFIHRADCLNLFAVDRLELELERAIRERSVAVVEERVDGTRVDHASERV